MPCGVAPLYYCKRHWNLPMADVVAIFDLLGWCYCLVFMKLADVIASGWCYCHICSRLMLLPWWLMLYSPMGELADVIAKVAWWNSHWVNLILIQMLCIGPHSIYEADGICLCFCLGMGHWPLWIEPLWLLLLGSGLLFPL